MYPFKLSIIIPAYNEANRIGQTIESIQNYLDRKKIKAELIVVNDGSSDQTLQIVGAMSAHIKNLKLVHVPKNQGKGHAVRQGVKKARGKYILITDADNSTPIEELDRLWLLIQNHFDIAIGSRYLKDSDVQIKQSFLRIAISRLGNFLVRSFLTIRTIRDTQCGFKLFVNKVAKNIFSRQKINRWGFDMEVLSIAPLFHYKVAEVPVRWLNSPQSHLHPVRDTLRTFFELLYIKFNLMTGKYL